MPPNENKWTDQQWAGITTTGTSLLVSAAAGSGKTAVLAERCVYLVCDAKPACEIDQLLVVTFTESAAAQMKSRIQDALRKRIAIKSNTRLARQLALSEHANVSTVHGFCARVLRQHFNLIGLDPYFQILDGDEAGLLRAEVARDLFDRRYENDAAGDFQHLIDSYGDGNDQRLIEQVISTHELLCSLVDPDGWITRVNDELVDAANNPIEKSTLGRKLIAQIEQAITRLGKRCNDAIAAVTAIGGFPVYVEQLKELLQGIHHWWKVLKQDGLDMLAAEIQELTVPKAPTIRGDPPGKELAKSLLDSVKAGMKKESLCELAQFTSAQWQAGMAAVVPQARTFLDLVREFSKDYTTAKNAQRALDFSDLERLTLDILSDKSGKKPSPSEVARGYHAQFHHVLVDEYQDINEIQDAILTLLSRECVADEGKYDANLFCVGDVKQSIFRFRLAEPKRFLDRQELFTKPDAKGQVIHLRENFRSRAPLLEAINAVFERLMTREPAEIEYDDSHRLRAGRTYPPPQPGHFTGAPIELHLMPADLVEQSESTEPDESEATAELERTDYEAILVARRIRRMTGMDGNAPMQVMKPDASGNLVPQSISFDDIVILLRSMQFKADTFADVLRGHGIPVHSEGGSGFFAAAEVRDMMALLQILDNQQQDIPLAAVLRSPLAGIPDADGAMAQIRLAYPREMDPVPFHQAVRRYTFEKHDEIAARLKDFFEDLNNWRDQARKRPVAELLWTIYDQTGYLAYCAGLDDGAQRVANLVELHERARQFGTFLRQGLYRFLRFMQTLRDQKELSRPPVASQAESVVKIMSIHRSKGLEFPVVILPDLGKKHNLSDSRGAILVDRAAGLGMDVVEDARQIRYPSLASTLVKTSLLRQTLAEEMRLLYVAITRAKEHLILIGTAPNLAMTRWLAQWKDHPGPLPADAVLNGKAQLDWIGPVAAMTANLPRPVFHVESHDAAEITLWKNPRDLREKFTELQKDLSSLGPLPSPPPTDAIAKRVIDRFSWVYSHDKFTRAPASAPVTSYVDHGPAVQTSSTEQRAPRKLDLPRFAQEQSLPGAADVGTITHLVLQHWNFDRDCEAKGIAAQIDGLIARKIISAEQSKHIDRPAIAWLLQTDVGRMLCAAKDSLMRELPFSLAENPRDIEKSDDPMDQMMIRGRIDLLLPDGEKVSIVDYKTDRVQGEALEERAKVYRGQMDLYRQAIHRICGKKVDTIYLIFLSAREVRKC